MKPSTMLLALLTLLTVPVLSFAGNPAPNSPEALIRRLYREYQPDNVKELNEEEKLHLGLRFNRPQTLAPYFDDALLKLFVKDANCTKRAHRVCNLDFDPIIDGQDFDERTPIDLQMERVSTTPRRYRVSFNNFGRHMLRYELRKTGNGWRISDIVYPSGHSLKKTLSRKLAW